MAPLALPISENRYINPIDSWKASLLSTMPRSSSLRPELPDLRKSIEIPSGLRNANNSRSLEACLPYLGTDVIFLNDRRKVAATEFGYVFLLVGSRDRTSLRDSWNNVRKSVMSKRKDRINAAAWSMARAR